MNAVSHSDPQTPIGVSAGHLRVIELIERVAGTDVELLITGETGVGKERYARYVHQCSGRAGRGFVAINCGGLPAELFENELFGHIGGAYTGARGTSIGLVNEAEKGTLFLDEVDALPLPSQVKLLRFVQEKEYRRLGEPRMRRADVRFIAASNANLDLAVRQGQFREDLLFRLRVVPLEVPPLRLRREDIPILLEAFSDTYSNAYHLPRPVFSDGAMRRILGYDWPGNVRELENCVRYLTCMQLRRPVDVYDLPLRCEEAPGSKATPPHLTVVDGKFHELKREVVRDFETAYILDALRRSNGNIARAAAASGKPRRVFFELMRKYGLRASDISNAEELPHANDPPRARQH
jgi:DNA-binding NtrC family response regulator